MRSDAQSFSPRSRRAWYELKGMEFYVYSRRALEAARPHEVPHLVISITSAKDDVARIVTAAPCVAVVRLAFVDREESSEGILESELFSDEHAREVWRHVEEHLPNLERIVVHCDAGYSRSPAVAAALARVLLGDDAQFFGPRYSPNPRVYRLMLANAPRRSLRRP